MVLVKTLQTEDVGEKKKKKDNHFHIIGETQFCHLASPFEAALPNTILDEKVLLFFFYLKDLEFQV